MEEWVRLERLSTNLRENIAVIEAMEEGDPEALVTVNSMLSEFFMSIDGKRYTGSHGELEEINGLFAELETKASSKTRGTNLVYVPHKLHFDTERSGDTVRLTVVKVQSPEFRHPGPV